MPFSAQLKAIRRVRGMTQAQVAGRDLSVSYVSLLESGRRQPTPETIALLARRLGCSPEELTDNASPLTEPTTLILRQAELTLEVGQADAARQQFERVLAAEPEDAAIRMLATVGVARSLHRAGRLLEAVEVYERAVRSGLIDPASSASTSVVLGWCRCLYELGELTRAAEVGTRTLEQLAALSAQDSEQSIQLLATVAAVWYELGDLRQAEALLAEGLERAKAVGSPTARGAILWNASTVAHERGRYQQALELADEALTAFRGGIDPRPVGRLLTTRGYFLLRSDPPQPADALEALRQAISTLGERPDTVDLGYALTEQSRAYLLLGRLDEAVRTAEQARAALGESAVLEHARATMALAAALSAQGEAKPADTFFREAATALEAIGASRSAARGWTELALTMADGGDLPGSIEAFTRAAAALNLVEPHLRGERRKALRVSGRPETA